MATQLSDERTVRFTVTNTELTNMIASKAREANLIDFDPSQTTVERGDGSTVNLNEWLVVLTVPPA